MRRKSFVEKYYQPFVRVFAALMLSAAALLLVYAFSNDWLPYQKDGDAFDTIYAIAESTDDFAQNEIN